MGKLVSVVVPVYNTKEYLEKCLHSLIAEQYMDLLEVLVVIDGSPDDSITIARKYEQAYPRTFVVISKENGGHGSCCNLGLKRAQGKYVRFLDSDDWLDCHDYPLYLKKLYDVDADLIQTNLVIENVYKGTSQKGNLYNGIADKLWNADTFDYGRFSYFIRLHTSTFKTETLRRANIFFTERAAYDDTVLYIKPLSVIKTIYFCDLWVYHYLVGRPGQSISSENREKNIPAKLKEFHKLCDSYLEIKEYLSTNKINYAERFINKVTIDDLYQATFRVRPRMGKEYCRQWNAYLRTLPFVSQGFASNHEMYNKFGYDVARLSYLIRSVFRKLLAFC